MSLGYLDSIKIMGLIPLNRFAWKLEKREGVVQVLLAPSGCGKTTLCDAIEYSLFQDLYYKEKEAIREKFKRSSKDNSQKGKIFTEWKFGNPQLNIEISIQGKKTFFFVNKKNVHLENLDKELFLPYFGVSRKNAKVLYNALSFVREDRRYPFFESKEVNLILKSLQALLFDPEIQQKKFESEARIGKVEKDLSERRQKYLNFYASIQEDRPKMHLQDALKDNQNLLVEIEGKITEKEQTIEDLDRKIENCLERPRSKWYEELIQNFAFKQLELKELNEIDKRLKKQIQDIGQEKLPDLKERKEALSKDPICPTCLQDRIISWEKRIEDQICPECGISWEITFELRKSADKSLELTRDILSNRQHAIGAKIVEIKDEIAKLKSEMKKLDESFKRSRKSCIGISKSLKDNQNKLENSKEKRQQLLSSIEHLKCALDPKSRENVEKIKIEIEQLKKAQELEEENLCALKEQDKKRTKSFISSAEEEFAQLAIKFLNFERIELRIQTGQILIDDHLIRFTNLSGSERDICDLLTRISLWKALLKYEKAKKGLLIIDSLEVYDGTRKDDMIKILQSLSSDEFIVIYTTSSKETAEKLTKKPKVFDCQRQKIWFFLNESQWLTEEEEEVLDSTDESLDSEMDT